MPFWNVMVKVTNKYFRTVEADDIVAAKQLAKNQVADDKKLEPYNVNVTANASLIDPDAIP